MRRLGALLLAASVLAGCGTLRKTFGVEDPPAYEPAETTSIYGTWVLGTPPDSTAFTGARSVELQLEPSRFTLTALYPVGEPFVLSGTASTGRNGQLVLTPSTGTVNREPGRALVFAPGEPITVLAVASGGTLVFTPPTSALPVPSSVWHKREIAEAAGTIVR